MTLDHVQAIFWSITYILLIVYAIKYKMHGIPLVSIALNFAWETVALANSILSGNVTASLFIHIAWFSLDCVIALLYLFHESSFRRAWKMKTLIISFYCVMLFVFAIAFKAGYMLLSSYAIDLIMAVAFLLLVIFKRVNNGIVTLSMGGAKLLGDLAAWLYYRQDTIVNITGVIVLICNVSYVALLFLKKDDQPLIKINKKQAKKS